MLFTAESTVLVIFCKRPKIGVGKQRVAAELGQKAALELSELLLAATLEDATAWQGPVVIAPADSGDSGWAAALLEGARVVPQQGSNLGERLKHVDQQLRAAGARRILYIGTDAPGLNRQILDHACRALDSHDTVLMPARDGGVTLLGSRKPWPELGGLPWETGRLCTALIDTCRHADSSIEQLPTGYDVDRFGDLLAGEAELHNDTRPARRELAAWIGSQLKLSIVIPVKQDTAALRELLRRLTTMLNTGDEIIVVSTEHSGECAEICEYFGGQYFYANASRGARLNRGATLAANNILWFLHADAKPDRAAIDSIRQQVRGGATGGYFRFRFRGKRAWQKYLLEKAINLRTRLGIPYGDQGLFMLRGPFECAGGFTDQSLFEEVALVKSLQGSGRFESLRAAIGVSPRRWEKDGWWRRTLHNRLLVLGYRLGIPAGTLTRFYRRTADTSVRAATPADQRGS